MKDKAVLVETSESRLIVSPTVSSNGRGRPIEDLVKQFEVAAPDLVREKALSSAAIRAGDHVRHMRKTAGLSQRQLATKLQVSQSRISEIESGIGPQGPTWDVMERIAAACNMKLEPVSAIDEKDADTLLMEDHRRVLKIFDKFKKLKDEDVEEKQHLVQMACAELSIHASLEEELFYPVLRDEVGETDLADEAEVEHTVVKQLVDELEEMTPDDELYNAKFKVLGEYVNHHVVEEEKWLIPQAKKANVDMQALGRRIQQRKQELQLHVA